MRYRWDNWLLQLPFLSRIIRLVNTTRFIHTFGMLAQAGIEVLEAMRMSSETVNNTVMRARLIAATTQVREGISLTRALKKTGYFSPLSCQLIASGENSAQLGPMLECAASNQENAIRTQIDMLLTLFEPAVILVMGSVVLFIVLAILLPIFDLNQLAG